ncbi:LysM peptidoglycan-binding domain-containing protein [Acinetobacter equi]|uniref:Peptidoglycan-binding protein LysM n=1 Tax=Acinetobacter equi TaxID=1324350 RepID=A0A0N9VMM1_9GAMM|nr:LysM peptidoglycan-binding domain-containing protein [Acinetobacter equi]ALH94624.1 peptidoglycan-binding protein LysM [Acinetobacter equi]
MKKGLNGTSFISALGFQKYFLLLALIISVGLSISSNIYADIARNINPPTLKANAPNVYLVKKGDTLWDISKKLLNNPLRWPEVWASNKHVKNPHWIFPNDRLLVCHYQGQPIIGKDEGDGCTGIIHRHTNHSRTLSPQVRIEALHNTIPIIPLENIKPWLDRSFIVSENTLKNTPYIVGIADQRVIAGAGQNVYIKGANLKIGQNYGIYAEGKPYVVNNEKDHKTNAGIELAQVASGVVIESSNDISTLKITNSYQQEVRRGDYVLPEHEVLYPTMFYPTYAENIPSYGKIIRIHDSLSAAATKSIVTINLGQLDGVKVGDVFAINQAGQLTTDPRTHKKVQLPSERIGNLMIIQIFDHLSYAYVLDSQIPIHLDATLSPSIMLD